MLQKLQSSGEMKGLLLFLFDQAAQLLGLRLRLRATVRVTQFYMQEANILERKMILKKCTSVTPRQGGPLSSFFLLLLLLFQLVQFVVCTVSAHL